MTEFKVGDTVRCITDAFFAFTKGKTYIVRSSNTIFNNLGLMEDDRGSLKNGIPEKYFELVKETKLKNTITLKELIEQDACKDGILWFMQFIDQGNIPIDRYKDKINNCMFLSASGGLEMDIEDILPFIKDKPEWITWLKEHGYNVEDKSEIKEEIKELKERLNQLEKKL